MSEPTHILARSLRIHLRANLRTPKHQNTFTFEVIRATELAKEGVAMVDSILREGICRDLFKLLSPPSTTLAEAIVYLVVAMSVSLPKLSDTHRADFHSALDGAVCLSDLGEVSVDWVSTYMFMMTKTFSTDHVGTTINTMLEFLKCIGEQDPDGTKSECDPRDPRDCVTRCYGLCQKIIGHMKVPTLVTASLGAQLTCVAPTLVTASLGAQLTFTRCSADMRRTDCLTD
jgi:hypothetical protein